MQTANVASFDLGCLPWVGETLLVDKDSFYTDLFVAHLGGSYEFVMGRNMLFASPDAWVRLHSRLEYHAAELQRFLDEAGSYAAVDHGVFYDMLLSWFAGDVKLKTLEAR